MYLVDNRGFWNNFLHYIFLLCSETTAKCVSKISNQTPQTLLAIQLNTKTRLPDCEQSEDDLTKIDRPQPSDRKIFYYNAVTLYLFKLAITEQLSFRIQRHPENLIFTNGFRLIRSSSRAINTSQSGGKTVAARLHNY